MIQNGLDVFSGPAILNRGAYPVMLLDFIRLYFSVIDVYYNLSRAFVKQKNTDRF